MPKTLYGSGGNTTAFDEWDKKYMSESPASTERGRRLDTWNAAIEAAADSIMLGMNNSDAEEAIRKLKE